jgi:hypothetical protein
MQIYYQKWGLSLKWLVPKPKAPSPRGRRAQRRSYCLFTKPNSYPRLFRRKDMDFEDFEPGESACTSCASKACGICEIYPWDGEEAYAPA